MSTYVFASPSSPTPYPTVHLPPPPPPPTADVAHNTSTEDEKSCSQLIYLQGGVLSVMTEEMEL